MMTMLERGYLTLARVRGVPFRLHWTLPIGMLILTGGRFEPGVWLGVLLVIALHEAGHAVVVHRVGLVNLGVDLAGYGGRCRWAGSPTPVQRALVAWGGVVAQVVLFAGTASVLAIAGAPAEGFWSELAWAFTRANLVLVAINLLPIAPLDGAEAWPLFRHLWRERKRRRAWKERLTLREALEEADRER